MSSQHQSGWHNYSIFAIIYFFSFLAPLSRHQFYRERGQGSGKKAVYTHG